MDEPLWAVIDNNIGDLEYAVEETVVWMCSVRTNYPEVIIVSIEPYPALSVTKIFDWIMRLETECEMHGITGIDAFCIDPNWACVSQFDWDDVRRIEAFCDSYDLPFSLIYWSADATTSSASDRDWYDGIIMQGGAYSGTPNEYVIE
ncbi:hypothetical protein KA005_34870, partial [bacterium]|nr:hypothetical protein [bacterium]